jgi:Ni/Fe-hydrogenase subunit HybB-like protein
MEAKTADGKIVTKTFLTCSLLAIIGIYFIAIRFTEGIGAVSHLTDHYPWGIWIVLDVIIGTALACGGYAVAILVYVLNRGHYHRLMRPALLTSLLGYSFAGLAINIDTGRYWNLINFLNPDAFQINSILFEVGICVMSYNIVLAIEFLPSILEKIMRGKEPGLVKNMAAFIYPILDKLLIFFIALGILLPTMHQSGLGGMMVLVGFKLNALWQTPLLSLLFLTSCISVGFGMVISESILSASSFNHRYNAKLLGGLAKIMKNLFLVFLIIRWGDIFYRGAWSNAFVVSGAAFSFWGENALLIAGILILNKQINLRNPRKLFVGAILLILGCILYRVNVYIIGFTPAPGAFYFPSVSEILITVGVISLEVLLFITAVKIFPVFGEHSEEILNG